MSRRLIMWKRRMSLRQCVKECCQVMNEGRKSQIVLLDDRRLDIIIQPKLYSNELLDLVASHFKLKEKQYFGLGFFDETNHFNWLQGEKRVLDHEFPRKTGLLVLYFAIKFYVDTIGLLRDIQTVELFYLNARQALFRGQLECDTETVFELAAHVLQATNGDFVSDEETKEDLKKLPVIPTSTLKEHPSIAYCEERVISFYEKLNGTSRGLAIVNYMTIVEKLPTYGIHYYDVKDKKDIPWWLGISPKGIAVYDKNDKTTPRKLFTWKNLENLYYRDKKFSIEVHGPKRIVHTLSSFNPYEEAVREPVDSYDDLSTAITEPTTQVSVSRRTFGASNVDVHAWFASTPQLTKCIWNMAVVQHQFYLDRKQSRSQLGAARSMSEIAADLCRSTTSLPGSLGSDLSRSPSSHSLPSLSNSRYDLTIEQSDSLKAERDMYQALKARKEALEEALRKKTEELKLLCFQEGELTGELPLDTPLAPGEQPPVFRRRVGTAFSLSVKNVQDTDQLSTELAKLELEVELQSKITSAAHRLASDKTVSKYVRKQRRQSYTKAVGKLKDMEKKLTDMRKQMGKPSSDHHHHASRAYEGTYHVVDPCSNHDLDLDHIIVVHDHSTRRPYDSCGNSIHSGELSVYNDSASCKDISCGDNHSASGTDSRSSRIISDVLSGMSDDVNSFTGSIDPHTLSPGDDTSSGFYSLDLKHSPQKLLDVTLGTNQQSGRTKHFVVSRGAQNSRLTELKAPPAMNRTKSSISAKSLQNAGIKLATCDGDSDVESESGDVSLASGESVDMDDSMWGEEMPHLSTRVMRRKQTFIMSRGLRNPLQIDSLKSEQFEKGWKTFEHILMGVEDVEDRIEARAAKSPAGLQHERIMQKHGYGYAKQSVANQESELSQKIQALLDDAEATKPLVRSRSFERSQEMKVDGGSGFKRQDKFRQSKDDIRVPRPGSGLTTDEFSPLTPTTDTTNSQSKKSFMFFTKKREKAKPMKHSLSDTQTFAVYGGASGHMDTLNRPNPVPLHISRNRRREIQRNATENNISNLPTKTLQNRSFDSDDIRNPQNTIKSTRIISKPKCLIEDPPSSASALAMLACHDKRPMGSKGGHLVGALNCAMPEKVGSEEELDSRGGAGPESGVGTNTLVRARARRDSSSDSEDSDGRPLRRRASWHSSSRQNSLTTSSGLETSV